MTYEKEILNELIELKKEVALLKEEKNNLKVKKCRINSTNLKEKSTDLVFDEIFKWIKENPKQALGYALMFIVLGALIFSFF